MTEPVFVSAKEAARILGISYWTVHAYVASGVLRSAKLPGKNGKGKLDKILIARSEVDRLINRALETSGYSTTRGTRLSKGPSVVDQILTERQAGLRIVKK